MATNHRELYLKYARQAAAERGLDPDLFVKLLDYETRQHRKDGYWVGSWNPNIKSPAGAVGIAQIMPATGRRPGFGIRGVSDRTDPYESIRFGADYLAAMMKRYGGDTARAVAAYNGGPGVADRGLDRLPPETAAYVKYLTGAGATDLTPTATTRGGAPARMSGRAAPPAPSPVAMPPDLTLLEQAGLLKALGGETPAEDPTPPEPVRFGPRAPNLDAWLAALER